jgi:hypothetical protein
MFLNRIFFLLGNLAPDISLSFLYRPHTYESTAPALKRLIPRLYRGRVHPRSALFAFFLGIVSHYICDYFCYPHHPSFKGGLIGHIRYEKNQTPGGGDNSLPGGLENPDPGFPKLMDMLDEYLSRHDRLRSQKDETAYNDIRPAVFAASWLASAVYGGAERPVPAGVPRNRGTPAPAGAAEIFCT